jgi:hypothetical protein
MNIQNPMQLTWPLPKYIQPGAPEAGTASDTTLDLMQCGICGLTGHKIGSTAFEWRCHNTHQWRYQSGVVTFLDTGDPQPGFLGHGHGLTMGVRSGRE